MHQSIRTHLSVIANVSLALFITASLLFVIGATSAHAYFSTGVDGAGDDSTTGPSNPGGACCSTTAPNPGSGGGGSTDSSGSGTGSDSGGGLSSGGAHTGGGHGDSYANVDGFLLNQKEVMRNYGSQWYAEYNRPKTVSSSSTATSTAMSAEAKIKEIAKLKRRIAMLKEQIQFFTRHLRGAETRLARIEGETSVTASKVTKRSKRETLIEQRNKLWTQTNNILSDINQLDNQRNTLIKNIDSLDRQIITTNPKDRTPRVLGASSTEATGGGRLSALTRQLEAFNARLARATTEEKKADLEMKITKTAAAIAALKEKKGSAVTETPKMMTDGTTVQEKRSQIIAGNRGVDLKVNGSDGPVYLKNTDKATIEWSAKGMKSCTLRLMSARRQGVTFTALPSLAAKSKWTVSLPPAYADHPALLRVICRNGETTRGSDEVAINQDWTKNWKKDAASEVLGSQTSLQTQIALLMAQIAALQSGSTTPNTTGASIVVTAPNGGEQWEIGQLNTVTWKPYGYDPDVNPAKDVDVYLRRVDGTKVGRVMDTGKASLHTYFNIDSFSKFAEPGQYRVQAVNRVTGEKDQSDKPFTLLPRSVDMKINGSDGPVTLTDKQPVTVTFKLGTSFKSCMLEGVRETPNGGSGVAFGDKYPVGTTFKGYAAVPYPSGTNTSISVKCTKTDGTTRSDYVMVNVGKVTARVQITNPNGGEKIQLGQPYTMIGRQLGLSTISIALYKNNKWLHWIAKDIAPNGASGTEYFTHEWTPSLTEYGNQLDSVYKIYVTGMKADGTGYVDDKSDATFSFTKNATSTVDGSIHLNLEDTTETLNENSDTTNADNTGNFAIEFEVTADETDVYIPISAERGNAKKAGVNFRTLYAGTATTTGVVSATLDSAADEDDGYYVVQEGETESFALVVMYDPAFSGPFSVQLARINWNDTATIPDIHTVVKPAADFETATLAI